MFNRLFTNIVKLEVVKNSENLSNVHSLVSDLQLFEGLVSLFNGISTFVGYLMPEPFSSKNSSGTI